VTVTHTFDKAHTGAAADGDYETHHKSKDSTRTTQFWSTLTESTNTTIDGWDTATNGGRAIDSGSTYTTTFKSKESAASERRHASPGVTTYDKSETSGSGSGSGGGGTERSETWSLFSDHDFGGDWTRQTGSKRAWSESSGSGDSTTTRSQSRTDTRDLSPTSTQNHDTFTGTGTTKVEWSEEESEEERHKWDLPSSSWKLVGGERSAGSDRTTTETDRATGTFRRRIGGPLPGMTAEVSGVYDSGSESTRSHWTASDSEVRDGEWVQTYGHRYADGSGSGHVHRTASGDGEYSSDFLSQGGAAVSTTLSDYQDKSDKSSSGYELEEWDADAKAWVESGDGSSETSSSLSYGFSGTGTIANAQPTAGEAEVPTLKKIHSGDLADGDVAITGSYTQDRTENGTYLTSGSKKNEWTREAGGEKVHTDTNTFDDRTVASRLHAEEGTYRREGERVWTDEAGEEQDRWEVLTTAGYTTTWIKDVETTKSGATSQTYVDRPWQHGGRQVLEESDTTAAAGTVGVWWYHDSTADHKETVTDADGQAEEYVEHTYVDELWDSEDRFETVEATTELGGSGVRRSGEATRDVSRQSTRTLQDGTLHTTPMLQSRDRDESYDETSPGDGFAYDAYFRDLDRDPERAARDGYTPGASRSATPNVQFSYVPKGGWVDRSNVYFAGTGLEMDAGVFWAELGRQVTSAAADEVPYLGQAKAIQEYQTGVNLVTGEKLGYWERRIGLIGVLPLGSKVKQVGKTVLVPVADSVRRLFRTADDTAGLANRVPTENLLEAVDDAASTNSFRSPLPTPPVATPGQSTRVKFDGDRAYALVPSTKDPSVRRWRRTNRNPATASGTQNHHTFPMFIGGDRVQVLETLPTQIHRDFHRELSTRLRAAGFPPVGGPTGGTAQWTRYMNTNPGSQAQAVRILFEVSDHFDEIHGSSIAEALSHTMIRGDYTPFP
jgi:hypothetical protein